MTIDAAEQGKKGEGGKRDWNAKADSRSEREKKEKGGGRVTTCYLSLYSCSELLKEKI